MNEYELFESALLINDPAARQDFLRERCGNNHELLRRVEALLASHWGPASPLSESGTGSVQGEDSPELTATIVPDSRTSELLESLRNPESSPGQAPHKTITGDHSILASFSQTCDVPRISLREESNRSEPIIKPRSTELPVGNLNSRYQVHGEIARGGMGAILKGRDIDLGRDLAIKVLLETHHDKPEVVQRFIEEAQIGGQLQHPGIAPVYELGQFSDQRPFFSMKLVKGETLSKLLSDRADTLEDRGRLLSIFEQICQTMAYAHNRGVIHRDLKPANIMVGAFGEVQVMDWGLAKVLDVGGVADERKAHKRHASHSVIQTMRSKMGSDTPQAFGTAGSQTQMGSVMGTPAYMPPEQALGEIDHLDERADVFGLGAILCEILTGKPPYVADDGTQVYRMAVRGRLEDCFVRLDSCTADGELIALTKHCLEVNPQDRPRDAGVLAERMTAYLTSVETRLRAAEVDRAAQAARAEEARLTALEHEAAARAERRARRLQVGLALVILSVTTVGGIGAVWTAIIQSQLRRNAELAEQAANTARTAERRQLVRAEAEQQRAESEKKRSDNMLADMLTERGIQATHTRQAGQAALWFAHAAKLTPHDRDRQHANRLRANAWLNTATVPMARLKSGDEEILQMKFQPKGGLLLTISAAMLRIWDWRNEVTTAWGTGLTDVTDAAWSPDGQQLAVSQSTGEVRLFDTANGRETQRVNHPERVEVICWSHDGTRLVTAGTQILAWNLSSPALPEATWNAQAAVYGLNFNRAGTRLVAACNDDLARVYRFDSPDSKEPIISPVEHAPLHRMKKATPVFWQGDRLVTVSKVTSLPGLWDVNTGQLIPTDWNSKAGLNVGIEISPDENWLAICGWNTCLVVRADGTSVQLEHANHVSQALFNSDGQSLITTCFDTTARVWPLREMQSHQLPVPITIPQFNTQPLCSYSIEGTALAIAANSQVVVWEQTSSSSYLSRIPWDEQLWRPRLSFDGLLVTPGKLHEHFNDVPARGQKITVVRASDGKPVASPIPLQGLLLDSSICSDHQSVSTVSIDGTNGILAVYDIVSGLPRFPPRTLPAIPISIDTHPQRPHVAVLCKNGQLQVIDTQTGELRLDLQHDGRDAHATWSRVAYSPDGASLVTLVTGDMMSVRQSETGELRFPAFHTEGTPGPCRSIGFSPNSRFVATAVCGKNKVVVWDLLTGRKVGREMPHPGDFYGLWSVKFSPDGQQIVTAHKDGRVRVWDWQTGEMIGSPLQHGDEVYDAKFTADGRYILACVRHHTLHIWDAATRKLAAPLLRELSTEPESSIEHVSLAGEQIIVAATNRYFVLDLATLLNPPSTDTAALLNRAELASNLQLQLGELTPIDIEGWNARWQAFVMSRVTPDLVVALAKSLDQATETNQRQLVIARAERLNLLRRLRELRPDNPSVQLAVITDAAQKGEHQTVKEYLPAAQAAVLAALKTDPENEELQSQQLTLRSLDFSATDWKIFAPATTLALSNCTFTNQPDGSILTSKPLIPKEEYTLSGPSPLRRITALRLETFPHTSLPLGGTGHDNAGNFCLTKVILEVRKSDGTTVPLNFQFTSSDFVRPSDASVKTNDGPWGVIDDSDSSRWDIYPEVTLPHWLCLELKTPYELQHDDQLVVKLQFYSEWPESHLGSFRLSVSDVAGVTERLLIAAAIRRKALNFREALAAFDLVYKDEKAALKRLRTAERSLVSDLLLAEAYRQAGDLETAQETLEYTLAKAAVQPPPRDQYPLFEAVSSKFQRIHFKRFLRKLATVETDLLTRKLQSSPDHTDNLHARGLLFARQGQWAAAASDFSREAELRQSNRIVWVYAGCCYLLAEDATNYRRICNSMLQRSQTSTEAVFKDSLIKLCLLKPGEFALADLPIQQLQTACKSIDKSQEVHHWFAACCGFAAARSEQPSEAFDWTSNASRELKSELTALILLSRAIAEAKTDQLAAATKTLAEAEALIPPDLDWPDASEDKEQGLISTGSLGVDSLIAEILRRELSLQIHKTAQRQSPVTPPVVD